MALVNIVGNLEDLDSTLNQCCTNGCFHIESALHTTADTGFALLNETNPYSAPLKKLLDVASALELELGYQDFSALDIPNDRLSARVDELEQQIHDLTQKKTELHQQIFDYEQAIKQIEHLEGSPVNFDTLFACKEVRTRFGRLPADSYKKLSYYDNKTFFFFDFDHNDDYYWGFYIAPTAKISVIDDIFASLFFEEIRVPDYAHGTPDIALMNIRESLEQTKGKLAGYEIRLKEIGRRHADEIRMLFSKLKSLDDTFDMRKYVAVYNNHFYLNGFIPKQESERFEQSFAGIRSVSCIIKPQDADPTLKPPVKLKNSRFAQPFESFVTMYGLPSHTDIDPTPIMAVTYTLLFGIMFGDLGQGVLIALIGWFLARFKKMNFGKLLIRIGLSSAFFGVIYGSVFGYEELLNPLYQTLFGLEHKPIEVMEDTNFLLIAAVGIGAFLILFTIAINVILGIRQKDYDRAFFSPNGLAGLVFYGSVLLALVLTMSGINVLNPLFIIVLIVLPLLLIFLREPLVKLCKKRKDIKPAEGVGNFIIQNFFEMFEVVLSYVTNTMSFLRIGGFILSHAGMMSVVMTLAHSFGSIGNPIVVVIGNLFVMGLEGLIVGIQVLRLEFYEVFSRFYNGDGKPFVPCTINYAIENQE